MNFREEFKFYRTKTKTPLRYSFVLPVHIKAELIKAETNDMMKSSLQDSFFRALFEGHIGPYLFITVSRDNIYKESMDVVRCLNIEDVRKQLRITFKCEEGVDSGGIRKEYFQLLSHEIKHDERLFYNNESTIWLRNDCLDMSAYMTIGKILGIALYNNVLLNIPFPSVFFKKLLGKKTTFYDLKEIDPELFCSLTNLKKLSEEDIAGLGLTFTINYTSSKNKTKTYNLTEDKSEKSVTKSNINSFVNRYADFYINRSIYRQFEAIKKGFLFVIERETLFYLDHKELEKIIMGSNDFDVHALRSTASYTDYESDSQIISWFWAIFESYGKKMRKKLLQFITGNDRIPVAGAASVKLIIMKNGCDTDRLPSSQTCFNTLLLPEYSSKKKLESKLRTALEMTAGFYLL
ncbi:Ubiquitin-protein ligase E3A [Nosema bombycis CQ1]|uniref:HECT-type E3 ubiquitin transferase n=1 Tax=Nosema bombycis (strain CQ1 / CVCC 102059) TaxID=578461 RepID=R0MHP0_NOSB1|nr:Ubiquitin-protein ligase E3A [Nosema bombycis CQ1]|eukprot:EOB13665.1 Ubiquitin-protein ligase E3A [Nosema bombycis CQ1]